MPKKRYQINKLLGKGRTGSVYEAEDTELQRKVALRRFEGPNEEDDFALIKDDFLNEVQSMGNLQHPNLLSIFDAEVDEEGAYIVSQILEGKSLHQEIQKGGLKIDEVIELAKQLLDAFSVAHDLGYYHGAFTPDSVMMVPRVRGGYRYVILDMGLNKLVPLTHGEGSVLTLMADPAILAPELFDGSAANARSDLYMLGQVLYLCIAGVHPFGGLSLEEAKIKHSEGLSSIRKYNRYLHVGIVNWLGKLIEVDPKNRPNSALDALNTLSEIPVSAFKAPAKLTETGVTPVFKSKSALSAIVESGPVKKMTTPIPIDPDSGKPSITLPTKRRLEDTTTEMALRTSSDDVDVIHDKIVKLEDDSQEFVEVPQNSAAEKRKFKLEFIMCILALIAVGVTIILVILASGDPSDYQDEAIFEVSREIRSAADSN